MDHRVRVTLGTAVLFVEGTLFLLGCNDTRVSAVLALRRITWWRSRDGRNKGDLQ
jgi:hypothetical protein